MNEKDNFLVINILRFFAACWVLSYHAFGSLISYNYLPESFKLLSQFTSYGNLGVNLFFIISGFVITLSSEGKTVTQFIAARFVRLFPVFWVCIFITSLFLLMDTSSHVSLQQYLANMTMFPFNFNQDYIDASYWTLRVELKFYLLIAIILLFRNFIYISIQNFALFLSVPLLYYSLFCEVSSCNSIFYSFFWHYCENYIQYFIAGILFYSIYKNNKNYYSYIALAVCYLGSIVRIHNHDHLDIKITMLYVTIFFITFLAISLKKINNNSLSFFGKNHEVKIITLGAITYPLYLLHNEIIRNMIDIFNGYKIHPYIGTLVIFFILVSLVLAVNKFDLYINTLWKQSWVIKKIISN